MIEAKLGAFAVVLAVLAVLGLLAWIAQKVGAASREDDARNSRNMLLGESLLKACGGDLTRAYAAIEREHGRMHSLFAERMAARKAAGVPPKYRESYDDDWRPQPQVDRGDGGPRLTYGGTPLHFDAPDREWVPAGADWRQR